MFSCPILCSKCSAISNDNPWIWYPQEGKKHQLYVVLECAWGMEWHTPNGLMLYEGPWRKTSTLKPLWLKHVPSLWLLGGSTWNSPWWFSWHHMQLWSRIVFFGYCTNLEIKRVNCSWFWWCSQCPFFHRRTGKSGKDMVSFLSRYISFCNMFSVFSWFIPCWGGEKWRQVSTEKTWSTDKARADVRHPQKLR